MSTPDGAKPPLRLEFTDEPGSARSKWVAGLLALALVGWMASGLILPAPPEDEAQPAVTVKPVTVAVRDSTARQVTQLFTAEGQAQPDRRAILRAETDGDVATLSAEKGDFVERGEEIARLVTREQEAQVQEAREEVARARREFENSQTLLERGVSTTDRVAAARATLASAEAKLTQAEEAVDAAVIRAPFAGRLDALDLDDGAYVSAGTEVGTILDTDPLSIVIQIPQQSLARISEGQEATVDFITGETRTGTVGYVSKDAASQTRTFRAEITVPNPGGAIASGLSVQVRIPTGQMSAHFVSPAILSLGPDGALGVKTVNDENKVVFHEVVLERAQTDGVWISGLPDTVRLITIGQGFVSDGEPVSPSVEADDTAAQGVKMPATTSGETN
ncbi:efflux RND transporter periplasmic adaptor subunit [Lutimaribacter marinistellae]|uniref:Efflux RND transporter periplasmic adaptor subunit n=1 Tax=Lutimaribacter marinistellae TaxID=1820329 RepID=A0ABV7TFF2_9RHOB